MLRHTQIERRRVVKFIVIEIKSKQVNIIIEGTLYIPILNTIILYIQQLAHQSDNQ